MKKEKYKIIVLLAVSIFLFSCSKQESIPESDSGIFHAQGEMAGEVTQTSVILQSRLTTSHTLINGDLPGSPGFGCFELSTVKDFRHYMRTGWIETVPGNDFIVKTKVTGLKPGTTYYYRLVYGADTERIIRGNACSFTTLSDTTVADVVSFVVVTGMNYHFFYHGRPGKPETAYKGADKHLGYPALESIIKMNPDFFVGTGDNVYYDHPKETRVKTETEMRKKWHEQFVQPRFKQLFAGIPTYWEKDDHDYRYNDADTTDIPDGAKPEDTKLPTHEQGLKIFSEQVPVVDTEEPDPKTYRTYRINKLLQIWLVEGRDYRSPNSMPDSPEKTLWGREQKEWLK